MAVASPLEHDMNGFARKALAIFLLAPALAGAESYVVVVEGLGGDEEYTRQFADQVAAVATAAATMTGDANIRVFPADSVARTAVLDHFERLAGGTDAGDQVAVYLIGHGSYDEYEYKFNIAGPDLTDIDLADALNALPSRNQLLVITGSASGAVAEALEDDRRLLVMATRSGAERHATRFGNYFITALVDPGADLDKNQLISVVEAFQFAERQVKDYFDRNDALATEHARMVGSHADRFSIARLSSRSQSTTRSDAELDRLIASRDVSNAAIDELRLARDRMSPEEYQSALLQKLLELAATEDAIESRQKELGIERQ
jgi:hypothetical protein